MSNRNIHTTMTLLLILAIMASTPALGDYPVPFTSDNWEGVIYCQNVNNGPWFPAVDDPSCALFGTSDTCWGMLRTISQVGRDHGISLLATPSLSSGGPHIDEAHIGFGDGYSFYQGQFVGLTFDSGRLYLGSSDNRLQLDVGGYTPGQTLAITLYVDGAGILTVSGSGLSGSLDTNGILPAMFHILLDVADSSDGITFCGPDLTNGPVVPVELSNWGAVKSLYR